MLSAMKKKHNGAILQLFVVAMIVNIMWFSSTAAAVPSPDLWARWQAQTPNSTRFVDHSHADAVLGKRVGHRTTAEEVEELTAD